VALAMDACGHTIGSVQADAMAPLDQALPSGMMKSRKEVAK